MVCPFLVGMGKQKSTSTSINGHPNWVVGQTPLLLKTTLTYVGLIVPLVLSGLMFFYVGKYFNQVGGSILKVALVTLIPMATNYFGDYVQQKQIEQDEVGRKRIID